jgi:glycosyltransferase involved in cell wall biosynthesis
MHLLSSIDFMRAAGGGMGELVVVMPVYNEEGSIGAVIRKWDHALAELGIDFTICVYNDGSRDGTQKILAELSATLANVVIRNKTNSGHGPTILGGYRENVAASWIFQIDSDDEMGPESFELLWSKRADYDLLIGRRFGRTGSFARKVISFISRLTVATLYGHGVWDVNSPYRLLRSRAFQDLFPVIPPDTFAPNVIVSGWACQRGLRIFETNVPNTERKTGTVSIKKWKLMKAAARSFRQTIAFATQKS